MRHGLEWIPEEDEDIDLPFGDQGTNLLIPAKGSALEACYVLLNFFTDLLTGGAGGKQIKLRQRLFIVLRPFQQIIFFIVVRDNRDAFLFHAHKIVNKAFTVAHFIRFAHERNRR